MPMPKAMKEKMAELTAEITAQIQDINSNPSFSAEEKKAAIKELPGASMQDKLDFMEKNFRNFDNES